MIRKYAEIFAEKNVSSFCSAKATHIFSAKKIRILYNESAKTVNEMTLNELVKLTTLWTTEPWLVSANKASSVTLILIFKSHYELNNIKGPSRPLWLSWMRRPTGDQKVAGSTPTEVGIILSRRLIMKYFLWSLPLIQEGQLSVSGDRMCTILVNRLED